MGTPKKLSRPCTDHVGQSLAFSRRLTHSASPQMRRRCFRALRGYSQRMQASCAAGVLAPRMRRCFRAHRIATWLRPATNSTNSCAVWTSEPAPRELIVASSDARGGGNAVSAAVLRDSLRVVPGISGCSRIVRSRRRPGPQRLLVVIAKSGAASCLQRTSVLQST